VGAERVGWMDGWMDGWVDRLDSTVPFPSIREVKRMRARSQSNSPESLVPPTKATKVRSIRRKQVTSLHKYDAISEELIDILRLYAQVRTSGADYRMLCSKDVSDAWLSNRAYVQKTCRCPPISSIVTLNAWWVGYLPAASAPGKTNAESELCIPISHAQSSFMLHAFAYFNTVLPTQARLHSSS